MSLGCFLKLTYEDQEQHSNHLEKPDILVSPFASSKIFHVPVQNIEQISQGEHVKTVYKLSLNLEGVSHDFSPGDTIGIIPSNDNDLVEKILQRLAVDSFSDKLCYVTQTSKKPLSHIPKISTLRKIFRHNVDVNTPAKKLFLKALQAFVTNLEELGELQLICSPQGSQKYFSLISASGRTLLGLLNTFPSCKPPVELILQNLPPLQPRPYSICSSPLVKNQLDITFFVAHRDDGTKGFCSGWLENIATRDMKVPFYFRQITNFTLCESYFDRDVILIATGTGLGPFRGFLQHKNLDMSTKKGRIWLFFGCRYSDRDFLYKGEMYDHLDRGVLSKLNATFSRENSEIKYVQDSIVENAREFYEWISSKNATIFICGNVKTVVKDVRMTIVSIIKKCGNFNDDGAINYLYQMENEKRYLVDSWF